MNMVELICPNCGARLEANPGDKSIKCQYCGTIFVVEGREAVIPADGGAQTRGAGAAAGTPGGAGGQGGSGGHGGSGGRGGDGGQARSEVDAILAPGEKRTIRVILLEALHAVWPIPGFRTLMLWKMIVAIVGYLFILTVGLDYQPNNYISESDTWLNRVFIILAMLSVVDVWFDWTHIYRSLPLIRSTNAPIRWLAKFFYSIVAFVVVAGIMVIIENLFFA